MPEKVKERIIINQSDADRKTRPVRCAMERMIRMVGFVCTQDGSTGVNPLTNEPSAFFTRVYRLKMDGQFVTTWVRFTYDLRDRWAEMEISHENLEALNKQMAAQEARITEMELRKAHEVA